VDVEFDSTHSARGALTEYLKKYTFLNTGTCSATDWKSAITIDKKLIGVKLYLGRSQWPCGLRRGSTAARLLGLWLRIPPRAWISVSCDCCVLSGRGLCDGLVPRPEESYRVWCV
jgi:hypothetical protein